MPSDSDSDSAIPGGGIAARVKHRLPFGGNSNGSVGSGEDAADAESAGDAPDDREDDAGDGADASAARVVDRINELHQDLVAPSALDIQQNTVEADGDYARTLFVDVWPGELRPGQLNTAFMDSVHDSDLSVHLTPIPDDMALDDLETKADRLKRRMMDEKEDVGQAGLQADYDQLQRVINRVQNGGLTMFDVSMYATVRAGSPSGVDDATRSLKDNVLEDPPARLDTADAAYRQVRGMRAASPIADDVLNKKNAMEARAAATIMPFISSMLIEEGGVDIGINQANGSPLIMNRFEREGAGHELVAGKTGAGKSFETKRHLLLTSIYQPEVEVVILDPLSGYHGLTEALGGENIPVGGDVGVNPMQIEPPADDDTRDYDPWGQKLKEVMGFFESYFEKREISLGDKEPTLRDAITETYNRAGITRDPSTYSNASPTIRDLIDTLQDIAEDPDSFSVTDTDVETEAMQEDAVQLAKALRPFQEGRQYANLGRETEVDISDAGLTYLDMGQQEMDESTGLMMQLMVNAVYEHAKQTDNPVLFVIDEAHYMLGEDENLAFLNRATRHARHHDMSMMFISQTLGEFFEKPKAEEIADQCSLYRVHRIDDVDEAAVDALNLSKTHVKTIQGLEMGRGERDFSEALVYVGDAGGWYKSEIRASEAEQAVIDYEPGDHPRDTEYRTERAQRIHEHLHAQFTRQTE